MDDISLVVSGSDSDIGNDAPQNQSVAMFIIFRIASANEFGFSGIN